MLFSPSNQRGKSHKFIHELCVGSRSYSGEDIITGWFDHLKELSSKKDYDKFYLEFLKQVEEEVPIILLKY